MKDYKKTIGRAISSCIESINELGKIRFYDEYDFPEDEREVEELIDFIAGQSNDNDIDFEVGYLKGLEAALRIVQDES